jgi:hypothetical protein
MALETGQTQDRSSDTVSIQAGIQFPVLQSAASALVQFTFRRDLRAGYRSDPNPGC